MAKRPILSISTRAPRLYDSRQWRRLRRNHLSRNPVCVMCEREGILKPASVADHIVPYKGDETLFWDADNLQSLCARHHNSDKQSAEKGGKPKVRIGADGWPA